jgi:predicted secreted hydrolase
MELLAAGEVFTVHDLLQCDEAYLKEACGLAKASREPLAEWISWQFAEGESGDNAA